MATTVLFMCPHAAGKSLLAATYFRAAAARAGLDVEIDVAGPEPDEHNMADVEASLREQGYTIGWQPRLVDESDIERADLIVNIGCTFEPILTTRTVTEWQVPMLSDDFAACVRAIHEQAEALASELSPSA